MSLPQKEKTGGVQYSDAELVDRACQGDVESFRQLYERHYGLAVGIARSQLSDRHLAEDAAQEALAVTCRKLHTLRNGAGFPSWLATIVRRTAVRMRRSQKNGQPLAEEPIAPPNEASSQTAIRVNEAIAGLPRSAREIVQLHYFSGLSYEEISRTLQITPQAVHGRLQRARRALATELSISEERDN